MSTRTRGGGSSASRWIRLIASMPSIRGMRMSMRITSGRSSRARATAASPSAASPTTSKSSWVSRKSRNPIRTSSRWSAMSRRMLMRQRSRAATQRRGSRGRRTVRHHRLTGAPAADDHEPRVLCRLSLCGAPAHETQTSRTNWLQADRRDGRTPALDQVCWNACTDACFCSRSSTVRLSAFTTARSEAVTMLGCKPTPQTASPSTSACT